jgi:uncharacterized MAPEG superfamily protein
MTLPFWCVFIGGLLPYVWAGASGALRKKEFGKADNNHPRIQQQQATGAAARAVGAERNAWEALMLFAPAVIAAHLFNPGSTLAPTLCFAWVGLRVLHGVLYLANLATFRSLTFSVAAGCSGALFLVAAKVL